MGMLQGVCWVFFLEEGLSCGVWVVLFFLRKFSELQESFIKQQAFFSVFCCCLLACLFFFSPVRWKTSSVKSTPPNCIKPAPTAQLLLGSNASFLTEARLEVYENQKNWKVNPVQEMMNCSAAQFLARNKGHDITAEEAEEVRKICIRDEMCHLCTKGCWHDPNDQHLKSQGHCEKVKEEALCNRLFGKSRMFRRLNSHGCRRLSKRAMRDFYLEDHPVDGRNPAPVDMVNLTLFTHTHTHIPGGCVGFLNHQQSHLVSGS